MAAGIATIKLLMEPGFYERLEEKAAGFSSDLSQLARKYSIPSTVNRVGSALTAFFTEGPVTDFTSALKADTERYGVFYRDMLSQGVWLAPSQFEAAFISAAHTRNDLEFALEKTEWSFKKMVV